MGQVVHVQVQTSAWGCELVVGWSGRMETDTPTDGYNDSFIQSSGARQVRSGPPLRCPVLVAHMMQMPPTLSVSRKELDASPIGSQRGWVLHGFCRRQERVGSIVSARCTRITAPALPTTERNQRLVKGTYSRRLQRIGGHPQQRRIGMMSI